MLVSALGFCTWGPVPGLAFPNLAEAMGETASSVLAPTWTWKDDLHFARQLYYGKIINGQPSFIAPNALTDCIAALAGQGSEEERDPLRLYLDGRLSTNWPVLSAPAAGPMPKRPSPSTGESIERHISLRNPWTSPDQTIYV